MATMTDTIFKGFDLDELRMVARVLMKTNPRVGDNELNVCSHIRDLVVANICEGDITYISTLGFVASGYWYCGNVGDWRYKVSLAAYGIEQYLAR